MQSERSLETATRLATRLATASGLHYRVYNIDRRWHVVDGIVMGDDAFYTAFPDGRITFQLGTGLQPETDPLEPASATYPERSSDEGRFLVGWCTQSETKAPERAGQHVRSGSPSQEQPPERLEVEDACVEQSLEESEVRLHPFTALFPVKSSQRFAATST